MDSPPPRGLSTQRGTTGTPGGGRGPLTSRLVNSELPDGHRLFLRMEVVRVVSASEPQQLSCRDGERPRSAPHAAVTRGEGQGLQLPRWAWARAGPGEVPSCSALLLRDRRTPAGLACRVPTPRATGPRGASPLPPPWLIGGPTVLEERGCQVPPAPKVGAEARLNPARLHPCPPPRPVPSPCPRLPHPPRPDPGPHRLVEGLHHGLGVVGLVVHHRLLQGLVVELLHVLGNLGRGSPETEGRALRAPQDRPSPQPTQATSPKALQEEAPGGAPRAPAA